MTANVNGEVGLKESKSRKSVCRLCGREFVPETPGWRYCPGVCSMTAGLIKSPKLGRHPAGSSKRRHRACEGHSPEDRFPRVMAMLAAPIERRWEMASRFTPEEAEFSRQMQMRMLAEERRIDFAASCCGRMDSAEDFGEIPEDAPIGGDRLGDSDDGSI